MDGARMLAILAFTSTLLALNVPQAAAQTCRWDGTAPFCDGECGGNETEITKLDAIPDFWVPPFVNQNPPFGKNALPERRHCAARCRASPVVGMARRHSAMVSARMARRKGIHRRAPPAEQRA